MLKKNSLCIVMAVIVLSMFSVPHPVSATGTEPAGVYIDLLAFAKYKVSYTWKIVKSADQSSLKLAMGESFPVNYIVTVSATPQTADYQVSGKVQINNYTSNDLVVNSLALNLTPGDILVDDYLSCQTPFVLPAGGVVDCHYIEYVTDTIDRTVTADVSTSGSLEGTTRLEKTVTFNNVAPTWTYDECIKVSDNLAGDLGTVCATDSQKSFTFQYSQTLKYDVCGDYQVDNTATFQSLQFNYYTGSSSWTVHINVPCAGGCSLTPGYWKTHSELGPAPYDDTWALLSNGTSTPFFGTGKTWYTVLWTPPNGNAYYILAHAYIAAYLNSLNGADISAITPQMDQARNLLTLYATNIGAISGSTKTAFINTATILDNYNNGLIGPGHCKE